MAMKNQINHSQKSSIQHNKDTVNKTLLCRVFEAMHDEPKTMLMVSRELNCERASICWKIKELRESDSVFVFKSGKCPISGHAQVGFYTTDMSKRENAYKQLKLF